MVQGIINNVLLIKQDSSDIKKYFDTAKVAKAAIPVGNEVHYKTLVPPGISPILRSSFGLGAGSSGILAKAKGQLSQ